MRGCGEQAQDRGKDERGKHDPSKTIHQVLLPVRQLVRRSAHRRHLSRLPHAYISAALKGQEAMRRRPIRFAYGAVALAAAALPIAVWPAAARAQDLND